MLRLPLRQTPAAQTAFVSPRRAVPSAPLTLAYGRADCAAPDSAAVAVGGLAAEHVSRSDLGGHIRNPPVGGSGGTATRTWMTLAPGARLKRERSRADATVTTADGRG